MSALKRLHIAESNIQPLGYAQHINLQNFRVACLQFQLVLNEGVQLPIFKGASLYGALEKAFAKIGGGARDFFYKPAPPSRWPDYRQNPPLPYSILPPLEEKTHYPAGEILEMGIFLYGSSIENFSILHAAIEYLGEHIGLGEQKAKFRIQAITEYTDQGIRTLYRNRQWLNRIQAMRGYQFLDDSAADVTQIRVRQITRLRLKTDCKLLTSAPPFGLFVNRLLGRINALASLYGGGGVITPLDKQRLQKLAETVEIKSSTLDWQDWKLYPQREGGSKPFGGLLGETVYCGELAPFAPWLNLGQWIGVGGKTGFGLGLYEMEVISA